MASAQYMLRCVGRAGGAATHDHSDDEVEHQEEDNDAPEDQAAADELLVGVDPDTDPAA